MARTPVYDSSGVRLPYISGPYLVMQSENVARNGGEGNEQDTSKAGSYNPPSLDGSSLNSKEGSCAAGSISSYNRWVVR